MIVRLPFYIGLGSYFSKLWVGVLFESKEAGVGLGCGCAKLTGQLSAFADISEAAILAYFIPLDPKTHNSRMGSFYDTVKNLLLLEALYLLATPT